MIGPHVWSFIGFGDSRSSSGDTTCDNCSVAMMHSSIRNSRALTETSGNFILMLRMPSPVTAGFVALKKLSNLVMNRYACARCQSNAVLRRLIWGFCKSCYLLCLKFLVSY
jgi:hypothetical protein